MYIIWLTFNLVPLEQKMGWMEEGMRLGGQAFAIAATVCIHPKAGIYQDLVGNFEGDNGFLTVWNKILTVFFKGLFFLNWKYLSELNLHKGEMKRRPVFLLLYWWSHHGMSRGKKSRQKQVTICKVLKQPDCFFFTYCSQCGLAPLWALRYPQHCQEKQTQPPRRRKGQEDKPGRGPRIYPQLTKGWCIC